MRRSGHRDRRSNASFPAADAPRAGRRAGAVACSAGILALAGWSFAGTGVSLVKDINPGIGDSFAESFTVFNGVAYFRAEDGVHGTELWRSDGTPGGTELVTDLFTGPSSGFPGSITVVGDSLYFNGYTEPTGSKVFKSDGTAAGTTLLADTYPGASGGTFGIPLADFFTPFGDQVLFAAADEQTGVELWRTDGTPAGTERVKDIHPGTHWSLPSGLTPFAGKIFFTADDRFTPIEPGSPIGEFDRELWVTDGTAGGTVRLKDINPGPGASIPGDYTVFNGQLLFSANDGATGFELWTTDGTAGGTVRLKDINPSDASFPMELTIAANRVFFEADDGATGPELWVTDGTEAGTRLVKDVNPAPSVGSIPQDITAVGDRVFFAADDGVHGSELWVSDGTEAGTKLVKDINPGEGLSGPLDLLAAGDKLVFVAIDPDDTNFTVKTQLWMTDGTELGTELLFEEPGNSFGYSIGQLTLLGNTLLFTAPSEVDGDGFSVNIELHSIVVPEPGALGLSAGAGLLLALRRRRSKS